MEVLWLWFNGGMEVLWWYDERKKEGGCTAQVRNEGEKGRK
jgi:hypothetical protein